MKPFTFVSDIAIYRTHTAQGDFSAIFLPYYQQPMFVQVTKDSLMPGGARVKPLGSAKIMGSRILALNAGIVAY